MGASNAVQHRRVHTVPTPIQPGARSAAARCPAPPDHTSTPSGACSVAPPCIAPDPLTSTRTGVKSAVHRWRHAPTDFIRIRRAAGVAVRPSRVAMELTQTHWVVRLAVITTPVGSATCSEGTPTEMGVYIAIISGVERNHKSLDLDVNLKRSREQ